MYEREVASKSKTVSGKIIEYSNLNFVNDSDILVTDYSSRAN
jgi:hypothetical protein